MSGKDLIKQVYEVSKISETSNIALITNHLKIEGLLFDKEGCKTCDHILTLTGVKIWRLEDVCKCGDASCDCESGKFCALDWIHVNSEQIVAFSLLK